METRLYSVRKSPSMMGVFTVSKRGTWGKPWETSPLRDLRGSKGILSHDKVVMKKQKSSDLRFK